MLTTRLQFRSDYVLVRVSFNNRLRLHTSQTNIDCIIGAGQDEILINLDSTYE